MATIHQIPISDTLKGGWLPDTKQTYIDLKTNGAETIQSVPMTFIKWA